MIVEAMSELIRESSKKSGIFDASFLGLSQDGSIAEGLKQVDKSIIQNMSRDDTYSRDVSRQLTEISIFSRCVEKCTVPDWFSNREMLPRNG